MPTLLKAYKALHRLLYKLLVGVMLFSGFNSSTYAVGCWSAGAAPHNIDPLLLFAIAKVESALNPRAMNRNRDGSYDVGIMQINSFHFDRLKKQGISYPQNTLVNDPCVSIKVGAEILAGFIQRHGYTWNAVGAYNAGSAPNRVKFREQYVAKVWREYAFLMQDRESAAYQMAASFAN